VCRSVGLCGFYDADPENDLRLADASVGFCVCRSVGLCGFYDADPENDLRLADASVYQFTADVHPWLFPADYCAHWRYITADSGSVGQ